jgi:hypothetical protein
MTFRVVISKECIFSVENKTGFAFNFREQKIRSNQSIHAVEEGYKDLR